MFPRAVLPLHIFEPRYRAMTRDALTSDKLIAVALLKQGFEPDYYSCRAPIHVAVGVGRIIASEQLADGRFNILLRGELRARIVEELHDCSYRRARLERLAEPCAGAGCEDTKLRERLCDLLERGALGELEISERWLEFVNSNLPLGQACDLIASSLPVVAEVRQVLLGEAHPLRRAALLIDQLDTLAAIMQSRRRTGGADHFPVN